MSNQLEDEIKLMELETAGGDEERKHFYRTGGAKRAEALIAQLDALRTRAQKFVRA
jgi:hypothetical protein